MRPREPAAPTSQADMKNNDDILCNLVIPMGAFLIALVCVCVAYMRVCVCVCRAHERKRGTVLPQPRAGRYRLAMCSWSQGGCVMRTCVMEKEIPCMSRGNFITFDHLKKMNNKNTIDRFHNVSPGSLIRV